MNPQGSLPIGHTVPTGGFDQGEHGAGIGLSGGYGQPNAQNSQSGGTTSGLGGSGIPSGTPIADKFSSQSQGTNSVAGAYAGGATDDALTGQSNAHRTGDGVGVLGTNLPTSGVSAASGGHQGYDHSHSHGAGAAGIPAGVSGAYAGSRATDALTGQSHAQTTGAGVGPLGENLHQSQFQGQSQGQSNTTSAALSSTAAGAAAGAGIGAGAGIIGTGVGAQGGSGGHYSTSGTSGTGTSTSGSGAPGVSTGGLASGTGAAGSQPLDAQRAGAQAHRSGEDVKEKLGLGSSSGAGAGAAAGAAGGTAASAAAIASSGGHYGTASTDSSRGEPVSDPKELDHGGRHGLVYQESTGKYVHRHEVEEK